MITNWIAELVHIRIDEGLFFEKKNKLDALKKLKVSSFNQYDPNEQLDRDAVWLFFSRSHVLNKKMNSLFFKILIIDDPNQTQFFSNFDEKYDYVHDLNSDIFSSNSYLYSLIFEKVTSLNNLIFKKSKSNLNKFLNLIKEKKELISLETNVNIHEFERSFSSFQKEILNQTDFYKINKFIQSLLVKLEYKFSVEILNTIQVYNLPQDSRFFPFPSIGKVDSFIHLSGKDLSITDKWMFLVLYNALIDTFLMPNKDSASFEEEYVWKEILDIVPYPLVLINEMGEVRQHNSLFLKLGFNPSDCIDLKSKQKILIHDISYNIFRTDISHFDDKRILIIFFNDTLSFRNDMNLNFTNKDLGIITSSIAHELSNPIAGILSALSYLMLDSGQDKELLETLEEMKKGATRCKLLIETFLGFSRAKINNPPDLIQSIGLVEICLRQAQDLLRFRVIESGIRLNLEFSRIESFSSKINTSVFTMTFYLLLSELMTLISHQSLLSQKERLDKKINAKIVETSDAIEFSLVDFNISRLKFSAFVYNLLKIENLRALLNDHTIRLEKLNF